MKFTKMQGAGNDYVYVNCFEEMLPEPPEILAGKVADRHFGIGSDGLVLIAPSEVADVRMRMFNPDGSESEMCGNAIRCVAKYVYEHDISEKNPLAIETGAGILQVQHELLAGEVSRVRVDMGQPILKPALVPTRLRMSEENEETPIIDLPLTIADKTFPVCCVSMGNPHCIVFVDDIDDSWVLGIGPKIEKNINFPRRTNVEFVKVLSQNELEMRVWERGTGETLACGTGACAVGVAAVLSGRTERTLVIQLPGGELEIEWANNNHVFMTGPAKEVFTGEIFF